MAEHHDFRSIIDLWPTRAALFRDLMRYAPANRRLGPSGKPARPAVRYWAQQNLIPPQWFEPVARAARARRFRGVTMRTLQDIRRRSADSHP